MDFYITPDCRQKCEHKLELMFKHWQQKPTIEYSEVQQIVKATTIVYTGGMADENGYSRYKKKFDAIKVTIGDLSVGEWTLVATVYYDENMVSMVDSKLFKEIPKQYGLEYKKCDVCGGTHTRRTKSFIVKSKETGEWKQVGSSCVDKLVAQGRYMKDISVKLFECFTVYLGGCDEFGWEGSSWRPADHYLSKAVRFDYAIAVCDAFIKENGDEWTKAEYDRGQKIKPGTFDYLSGFFSDFKGDEDDELYRAVCKYYEDKEGSRNWCGEKDLTQKIKEAIEDEYIGIGECYVAFFALKSYKESLTAPEWKKALASNGIEKDVKYEFRGKLLSIDAKESEDVYGYKVMEYFAQLEDSKSRLKFYKQIAHSNVLEKYKLDDGTYAFMCNIRWIDNRKRKVKLGGRMSKIKKLKYAEASNNIND